MSDKILRDIEVMDVVKGVGSAAIDTAASLTPITGVLWGVVKSAKENVLQRRNEVWQREV